VVDALIAAIGVPYSLLIPLLALCSLLYWHIVMTYPYYSIDFSSEVADDSQPNLCRITAYEASEDPEPISMNTGKVGSLFKEALCSRR